ncbi:MAG: hypothetical protein GWN37_12385 [Gammaproteobacteria bacterium]|nr:hypothetical protein [Gammaproteobacteria bacterium]
MTQYMTLDLQITQRAKTALMEWMNASGIETPIPGILWAKISAAGQEDWVVGLYDKTELSDNFPGYIGQVNGIELLIPQGNFSYGKLEGKLLDIVDGHYAIVEHG